MLAPAGIDMGIVRKINADVAAILKTPDMVKLLGASGAEPLITSPEEFLAILKSDVDKWAKVVKAAGVRIN
jgi:tripartite-type tricarboxylate transporter receptor subunit TctC